MDVRQPDRGPIIKPAEPHRIELKANPAGEMRPAAPPRETLPPDSDDPNRTFHEEPLEPAFARELATARQALEGERSKNPDDALSASGIQNSSGVTTSAEKSASKSSQSILQKAGDIISKAAWEARLTSIMFCEFGSFHPAYVNGRWCWVVRPWAHIKWNSRQPTDYGDATYYRETFDRLKAEGKTKIIDMEQLGGETPYVRPVGIWGLELLDTRRILAAKGSKLPIIVKVSNRESFD